MYGTQYVYVAKTTQTNLIKTVDLVSSCGKCSVKANTEYRILTCLMQEFANPKSL